MDSSEGIASKRSTAPIVIIYISKDVVWFSVYSFVTFVSQLGVDGVEKGIFLSQLIPMGFAGSRRI